MGPRSWRAPSYREPVSHAAMCRKTERTHTAAHTAAHMAAHSCTRAPLIARGPPHSHTLPTPHTAIRHTRPATHPTHVSTTPRHHSLFVSMPKVAPSLPITLPHSTSPTPTILCTHAKRGLPFPRIALVTARLHAKVRAWSWCAPCPGPGVLADRLASRGGGPQGEPHGVGRR